jgi:hypothetical protein
VAAIDWLKKPLKAVFNSNVKGVDISSHIRKSLHGNICTNELNNIDENKQVGKCIILLIVGFLITLQVLVTF